MQNARLISLSRQIALQRQTDVVANNIANMNTVGFKRQRAEFQDLLYQTLVRAGSQTSSQGTIVPTGVQVGAEGDFSLVLPYGDRVFIIAPVHDLVTTGLDPQALALFYEVLATLEPEGAR